MIAVKALRPVYLYYYNGGEQLEHTPLLIHDKHQVC